MNKTYIAPSFYFVTTPKGNHLVYKDGDKGTAPTQVYKLNANGSGSVVDGYGWVAIAMSQIEFTKRY